MFSLGSFTNVWEQRKLKDLCTVFADGDWIESKDQSNSGVRLLQTGNVGVTEFIDKPNSKKWVSDDTFDRLHCTEVRDGDILISRLPEPAGRACIVPKLPQKLITAVDCTIVRTSQDCDSNFLVQYLSTAAYFNEVNNCLAGGTRQRISRSNLASFAVPTPRQREEQAQIGQFFATLDNIITLHQRAPCVNVSDKRFQLKPDNDLMTNSTS
jgi:type I restriction enzyme S subunit